MAKLPRYTKRRLTKHYTWGLTRKTGKRKGTYLWFKQAGARNRNYWKYDPDIPLDVYHMAMQSKVTGKTHTLRQLKRAYKEESTARGTAAWKRYRNYLSVAGRRGNLNTTFHPARS